MKKAVCIIACIFMLAPAAFAETKCDVWLGTWDVVKEDGSTCVWVIDEIVTGTSSNIPCQAKGTSTPSEGGESTPFQIITVSFAPGFFYTESKQLGEGQQNHELEVNEAGDAFVSGTLITDYDIVSGTKRVSGPRCGGVSPKFVSAGDNQTEITIAGTETSFDNDTVVTIGCPEVTLVSYQVDNETKIRALIEIAEDAEDTSCSVSAATGDEQILCSLEVRGAGNPELVSWSYETGGIVSSSPIVSGERVYFGSGDGNVYCLDAAAGTKLWEYAAGNAILSSPAVSGGKVYVGSNDNKLYCLNALDGTKIWEFETQEAVQSSPAVVDGYVYVGGMDDNVYCLNAETGEQVWSYTTQADVFSTPAVVDGKVYIGGVDFILYCLDAQTGELQWQFETEGDIPPSPAVANGRVYFGSKDNYFYCVDAETGQKLWDFQTGDIVFDSPAVYEGFVYFGSLDKKVYCLNAQTGAFAWQFEASGLIQSSPAVTDDYVYVGSSDKNVYCLDSSRGTRIWNYKTNDTVVSSPAVVDGKVYVGSYDKTFYCLNAPDDEEESWPMFRYNLTRTGAVVEEQCPVAAVMGAQSEEVQTLRRFRDEVLAGSVMGDALIDAYTRIGPRLTKACKEHPRFAGLCRFAVNAVMPLVEAAVPR